VASRNSWLISQNEVRTYLGSETWIRTKWEEIGDIMLS
jgi:hypothetical protein